MSQETPAHRDSTSKVEQETHTHAAGYEGQKAFEPEATSYGYRLLSRLKSDCDYMLGAGGPGAARQLWAEGVEEQIAKMREVYTSLPKPPEWITAEDIDRYEREMTILLEGRGEEALQAVDRAHETSRARERSAAMAGKKASIYVANLGKYNEGELVGSWIDLPVTAGELDEFLENAVGLELNPGRAHERTMAGEVVYEEYAIHDYENDGLLADLGYRPHEHDNIHALNDMAALAAEADERDLEAVALAMEYGQVSYTPDEVSNLLIQADDIPYFAFDYACAHVKDSWGQTCLERSSAEENLAYTLLEGSPEMKALDDAGLLAYFDFEAYGRAAAQEYHLTGEGYMPADADPPSTDLYDREEIAKLAQETLGETVNPPAPPALEAAFVTKAGRMEGRHEGREVQATIKLGEQSLLMTLPVEAATLKTAISTMEPSPDAPSAIEVNGPSWLSAIHDPRELNACLQALSMLSDEDYAVFAEERAALVASPDGIEELDVMYSKSSPIQQDPTEALPGEEPANECARLEEAARALAAGRGATPPERARAKGA